MMMLTMITDNAQIDKNDQADGQTVAQLLTGVLDNAFVTGILEKCVKTNNVFVMGILEKCVKTNNVFVTGILEKCVKTAAK